jgi:DNA polymerase-3 subunit delta'
LFRKRLDKGQLAHALLIQGPEGTGKAELAGHMVARLLCTGDSEFACGQCRSCTLFAGGAHPDCFRVKPDEGKHQIVIEKIRSTIASLSLTASFSPRKVALISPAEAMNNNAANALLKCLEEPPGDTVVILVSHDASRLPVTVRSRCQSIAIALPETGEAMDWLTASQGLEPELAGNALAAAGGRPVHAVQIARSGQVEMYRDLQQVLSALLSSPAMVAKAASDLSEIDANSLWTWLSNSSAEALRAILTGERLHWLEKCVKLDQKDLSLLQRSADQNRMFSKTPVRQDLLLREWLIKWSRLAA